MNEELYYLRQKLKELEYLDDMCWGVGMTRHDILADIKKTKQQIREETAKQRTTIGFKDVLNGQRRITQEETTGKD